MHLLTALILPWLFANISSRTISGSSTTTHTPSFHIPNGDLIFVKPPLTSTSPLDRAILATGTATLNWLRTHNYNVNPNNEISLHVALSYVAVNHSRYFIQAIPPQVVITPEIDFYHMIGPNTQLFHGALSFNNSVRAAAIKKALLQVGKPYANDFQAPSKEFYCSSLIEYSYFPAHSFIKEIFKLIFVPTSFWKKYYRERNISLPINVTGSNPTLLMYSPFVNLSLIDR